MKLQSSESKSVNWRELFPAPWPAIWLWIFLAIIVLGLATPNSLLLTIIKVGGILLCFVYALLIFPQDHLLQAALCVTFIADIILAINNTAEGGVFLFFIAQLIHFWRLSSKRLHPYLIAYASIAITTMIVNFVAQFLPTMYILCLFYVIIICANIDISWRYQRQEPKNPHAWFALIGFVLFLCCDTCTALSYLSLNQAFPAFLYLPANFFAWFFYYPSQIFISNSSKHAIMLPKGR